MADDSAEKTEVTALALPNPNGKGMRKAYKGKDGRFVSGPKRKVTTSEITRMGRKLMNMPVPEKIDGKTANRFQKIFLTLYDIATNEEAKKDAKFAMAAVQAAKELMLRVAGKPSASDEEMDALKHSGIQIVMVPLPELMHPEPVEEKKSRPVLKPSFIDAEIVSTNEAQK